MVRILFLSIGLLAVLLWSGCAQQANKSLSPRLNSNEQARLTAYQNAQAVIRKDGKLLCDHMTDKSLIGLISLGQSKNWPGARAARTKKERISNCPRVAEAFLEEINQNNSQKRVYENMARQITNKSIVRMPSKGKAEVVIPRMIEKNGSFVLDPEGSTNALKLEYHGGRWLIAQCKWKLEKVY